MTTNNQPHDLIVARCVQCNTNEMRGIHMGLQDFRDLLERAGWEINEYKCPNCNGTNEYFGR